MTAILKPLEQCEDYELFSRHIGFEIDKTTAVMFARLQMRDGSHLCLDRTALRERHRQHGPLVDNIALPRSRAQLEQNEAHLLKDVSKKLQRVTQAWNENVQNNNLNAAVRNAAEDHRPELVMLVRLELNRISQGLR